MFNLKSTIGAAIILATVSTANAGSLVLDSFNYNPVINVEVNSTGNVWRDTQGALTNIDSPNNGILTVDLLLKADDGNPTSTGAASSFISGGSGSLSYNNDTGISSEMSLYYSTDGIDPSTTLAPVDFTFGGAFTDLYFDVSAIDLNFTATIYILSGLYDPSLFVSGPVGDIYSFDTAYLDSILASSMTIQATNAIGFSDPAERLTASFDDLVGDGDITAVTGIFAIFSSTSGAFDFKIDEIGLTDVPEPTSLAILGLGLLGFGVSRRKA
ncbi:MAG: PEP-CTERM sorting domain-containing protein [Colwellia sp.]|nr:PEP-CTERM sorting domain-containing protein [Colwellia sp.]